MENQPLTTSRSGRKLIILGFVSIVILFLLYSRYQDPELITPEAFDSIQRIAYAFYIILISCIGAITYGLYIFHKAKVERKEKDLFTIIAITTWNAKSRKIFLATFVGYDPGYMPKVIIYLTEHVGLQIIPINLILQVIVSYLVGLNTSIAISAFVISKKGRGMSTIGAATGLFIACPTCAGTFLSIFVGTASGIALTIALTQLQTLFIAIAIPILLITPFIMAKKLRNADGSCKIDPM
ncbi:MAG: hypothetical protein P8X83_07640 [Nitrosopumilaceae archaeon]